jgi:glucose/mannose transport system substrate-binding protein
MATAAILLCSTGACGRAENHGGALPGAADPTALSPIEVHSWWGNTATEPWKTLIALHKRRYPRDGVVNPSAALSGLSREALKARLLRYDPPDLFQANAGADLMQWVAINGLDDRESLLAPLDDLVPVAEWRRTFPRWLLDETSYNGKLYGLPSDLHRINMLFYNKKVFQRLGLSRPTSLEDLKILARKIRRAGIDPLALGTKEPWSLSLLIFECLLISREGADYYAVYFVGNGRPDDQRIARTLRTALELREYLNPDYASVLWPEAAQRVVDGRAAMTVMGDWAEPAFTKTGARLGEDFEVMPFPGTAGVFVFTSDAYALPARAKNAAGAARLLTTMASVAAQQAVATLKGALPARADAAAGAPDPHVRAKYAALRDSQVELAQSGMVPPLFSRDLNAALVEMMQTSDIEPVLQTLRSRYPLLLRRIGWGHPHYAGARVPAGDGPAADPR